MVQTRSGRSMSPSHARPRSSSVATVSPGSLQKSASKAPNNPRYYLRSGSGCPGEPRIVSREPTRSSTNKQKSKLPLPLRLSVIPPKFIPSRLGIPPSPHSPRSPCLPLHRRPHPSFTGTRGTSRGRVSICNVTEASTPEKAAEPSHPRASSPAFTLPPAQAPADEPFPWTWTCHQCTNRYSLGVTRRCLLDGHVYCIRPIVKSRSTSPANKPSRRRNRETRVCSSNFDYLAWRMLGMWRRHVHNHRMGVTPATMPTDDTSTINANHRHEKHSRDCWMECDFPAECKYARTPLVLVPVMLDQLQGLTSSGLTDKCGSKSRIVHELARGGAGSMDKTPRSHPTSWNVAAAHQEANIREADAAKKRRQAQRRQKTKRTRGLDFWRPLLQDQRGKMQGNRSG